MCIAPDYDAATVAVGVAIVRSFDDDRNVLYNVYVKYKAWYITDRPSDNENYKLFISDTGDEIHTEWKINNSTLQTYGKSCEWYEVRQRRDQHALSEILTNEMI